MRNFVEKNDTVIDVTLDENTDAKLLLKNWNGFDHSAVQKRLEGDLQYLGHVSERYGLSNAVYFDKKPNKAKGHKSIVLLTNKTDLFCWGDTELTTRVWIVGMDLPQFKERFNKIAALYCPKCGWVIYSCAQHNYQTCECGKCIIDGGSITPHKMMGGEAVDLKLLSLR